MRSPSALLYPDEGVVWGRGGWTVMARTDGASARLLAPGRHLQREGAPAQCIADGRRLAPPLLSPNVTILLHGMGRTVRLMDPLATALHASGQETVNMGYPSLLQPIERHATQLQTVMTRLEEDGARSFDFVGHSLGGLVIRLALGRNDALVGMARRVVYQGTPQSGSSLAVWLSEHVPEVSAAIFGPSFVAVLGAMSRLIPVPPRVAQGVMAGGTGGAHGYNPLLAGDNDLIVTVSETRLGAAETDFIRVPSPHFLLPRTGTSIRQTLEFLATGHFRH